MIFQGGAAAIFHPHFRRRGLAHIAVKIHPTNGLDHLKCLAAHRSGVHAQRAADAAGNALEKFQAAQALAPGFNRNIFQLRTRAAAQARTSNFNLAEIRVRQANDRAAKTAVAHQQIRAASDHEKRHAALAAAFHDDSQIRLRRRLDINIRRAADAQRRMPGQRLVTANHRCRRNPLRQFTGDIFHGSHRPLQNVG